MNNYCIFNLLPDKNKLERHSVRREKFWLVTDNNQAAIYK